MAWLAIGSRVNAFHPDCKTVFYVYKFDIMNMKIIELLLNYIMNLAMQQHAKSS